MDLVGWLRHCILCTFIEVQHLDALQFQLVIAFHLRHLRGICSLKCIAVESQGGRRRYWRQRCGLMTSHHIQATLGNFSIIASNHVLICIRMVNDQWVPVSHQLRIRLAELDVIVLEISVLSDLIEYYSVIVADRRHELICPRSKFLILH